MNTNSQQQRSRHHFERRINAQIVKSSKCGAHKKKRTKTDKVSDCWSRFSTPSAGSTQVAGHRRLSTFVDKSPNRMRTSWSSCGSKVMGTPVETYQYTGADSWREREQAGRQESKGARRQVIHTWQHHSLGHLRIFLQQIWPNRHVVILQSLLQQKRVEVLQHDKVWMNSFWFKNVCDSLWSSRCLKLELL